MSFNKLVLSFENADGQERVWVDSELSADDINLSPHDFECCILRPLYASLWNLLQEQLGREWNPDWHAKPTEPRKDRAIVNAE